MDLSDLKIFSAVVREGGVTRAAQRLYRVQSNVTTRIRQLEEELGIPLFIREGKRLHLSPAGQVLLDYADRLLALADEARNAVQDPRPRGVFRLGAMESTAAVRLPGPVNEYHRLYPDVVLELRTGNPTALSKALLANELDAALVTLPIAEALFEKVAVFEEEPVIVSAADTPAIGKGKNAYFPRTILAFEHGCPHRKRLEDWYALRNQMPERTIELGSYHAMLGCVVAGMGVALLPRSVLTTFPESRRLKVHRLPPGENRADTYLIWRKGADSPKVHALRDLLTKQRARSARKAFAMKKKAPAVG
ncbi:LysR family transcriptional regulator [Bradyrhizobium sp. 157]|uniref:LysR substrate-binding domain-containing protein n=1 Tax=Bradyrhizobium sp. 157 TaxID=2782631 RepID=UPI001FF9B629|nr:LysR substrate-binding domain-containing protein [Bradyrhizobium sp. 157]MCK1636662.1 LysR family transcriptional regulator [Bradyrhizobium sp. 157]